MVHERALEEFAEASASYDGELATRFEVAIDEAMKLIAKFPMLAPKWESRPLVRRYVIQDFPYAIVYGVEGDPFVYAVPHLSRRPNYWLDRVPKHLR